MAAGVSAQACAVLLPVATFGLGVLRDDALHAGYLVLLAMGLLRRVVLPAAGTWHQVGCSSCARSSYNLPMCTSSRVLCLTVLMSTTGRCSLARHTWCRPR